MLSLTERDEICGVVESLRGELDDLAVRGLKAVGASDLHALEAIRGELAGIGASHLSARAAELLDAVRAASDEAGLRLMQAQTSLRLFERVLTLEHVALQLEAAGAAAVEPPVAEEAEPEPAAEPEAPKKKGRKKAKAAPAPARRSFPPPSAPLPVKPPPPPLTLVEAQGAIPILEELGRTVLELVSTGLTTASPATRQKLDVAMKEALRLKLGRLGAALRFVNEEIGRFLAEDAGFSGRRLAFFLNRSWLLARGLSRAARAGDGDAVARLLLAPRTTPVPRLQVACIGVGKRIVRSTSSCAFEFRLRTLTEAPPLPVNARLVWSCLFSHTTSVPPEAFLHLPQPQRFYPRLFCESRPVVIEKAAVALDESGGGRLLLGPDSTVTEGDETIVGLPDESFDVRAAAARLHAHRPGPLDIEIELQEEVVLRGWELGDPVPRRGREDQLVYPLRTTTLSLDAVVSSGDEGQELRAALEELRAPEAKRPPLFGLVHYELCRLVLQPLSLLTREGPRHLMISGEREFDPKTLAELTRALMNRR
jgi:hypothetical protein